MAVPKPTYPLPTWLTHFVDYEDELLAEFCPTSEDSSPLTPTSPATVIVGTPSEHVPNLLPLATDPLLDFSDSGYTNIEVGDWNPKEDGDFDEEDEDYDPFEFDTNSDFWSDCSSFRSESSAPASHRTSAIDWSAPFQGQVGSGEGYSCPSPTTILEFPPLYSPSPPPSSPHVPSANSHPWPIFTNSFTGAPITASPVLSPVALVSAHNPTDGYMDETDADRFLMEVEEGLGIGSRSGSIPGAFETETEEWYDRFDLTGYTLQVLPQQPQSRPVAAESEAPPLAYKAVIPLPDTEEDEDVELDAVVVSAGSSFWWW